MTFEEFDKTNESFEVSVEALKIFDDEVPEEIEQGFEKFIVTLDMVSPVGATDIFSMLTGTDNKKQILLTGITSSGEEHILNYIFIGDKYNETGEELGKWYLEGKKDWEKLQEYKI